MTKAITTERGNPKMYRAAMNWLENGNQMQAMIDAGYSRAYAKKTAGNFFEHPYVASIIREQQEQEAADSRSGRDNLIRLLCDIAFTDLNEVAKWDDTQISLVASKELSKVQASTVKKVSMTRYGPSIEQHSKLEAVEKLLRIKGMYREDNDQKAQKTVMMIQNNVTEGGLA